MSFLYIPILWFGTINVKLAKNSLFSERNGFAPSIVLVGIRFTWRARR